MRPDVGVADPVWIDRAPDDQAAPVMSRALARHARNIARTDACAARRTRAIRARSTAGFSSN